VTRTTILLAAALAALASVSAVAGAQGRTANAHVSRAATVQVRSTGLGKILVDASGFTLYEFTRDGRNTNTCVKVKGCSKIWPALSSSSPTAGPGVKASLLSTIRLSGGARQVTYAGHALYTYSEATERAETAYVGVKAFGGNWDALNAAGKTIK
jgi:predicted lipoprotein with Yx(FWY)xxD motif